MGKCCALGNADTLILRTSEFLWQEGHTAHATYGEAEEEAMSILELYRELAEDYLGIPVITGIKTETEKFAGADKTYCIEAMMRDKRALQAGTSHNLGQNFAKAFDVKYQNKDNKDEYVWATSWGISTRLVGAVILTHGDNKGLRLPPKIAPIQVIIIPIFKNEQEAINVKQFIEPILSDLSQKGFRVQVDWTDSSPGFKFNEWEMKGVPLRIEVGPRDISQNNLVFVKRTEFGKQNVSADKAVSVIPGILDSIQNDLYKEALEFREKNTHTISSYKEFKKIIKEGGFVRCGWDGAKSTESKIKEETRATIRCIPFDENPKNSICIFSGDPAKHEVIFARAY